MSSHSSRVFTAPPETLSATLHTVAIMVDAMKRRGIPAGTVLANSGITPELLRQPTTLITRAQELTVFANALYQSGDTALGLEVGNSMHMPSYGVLGYAMMVNPNLGAALRCALAFPVLLGSYFRLSLDVRGGQASIVASDYHYRPDLEVLNTDMCLASMWAIVGDVLGRRRCATRLTLTFPAPPHAALYRRVLGCEPEFEAERNAVSFPGEWLDRTLVFSEAVSCQMAMQQCEALEREWSIASGDSTTATVLRLMSADPRRYKTIDDVAAEMFLSGRTLRRRLQAAGTTFQTLQDQLLLDRALDYLTRTNLPIASIADRLGYSETASFRQAFRRWTGRNPSSFRRTT